MLLYIYYTSFLALHAPEGCALGMTLPPSQGQILQVKFQVVKSSTPQTQGPADLQGDLSLIDLMNHIDNSPFSQP